MTKLDLRITTTTQVIGEVISMSISITTRQTNKEVCATYRTFTVMFMYIYLDLIYHIWRSFQRSVKFSALQLVCIDKKRFNNLTMIDVSPKMANVLL